MEYQKELTTVLWVIALFGMFFLARGITGNIVASSYSISDSCTNDKECSADKICCVINGVGNCNPVDLCNELKDKFSNQEKPLSKDYNFDIGLGLLILLCVLIASYSTLRASKNKLRNKKKAKRRR